MKVKFSTLYHQQQSIILTHIMTKGIRWTYTADNDTEMNRPVILFIHGGGFLNGDKNLTCC